MSDSEINRRELIVTAAWANASPGTMSPALPRFSQGFFCSDDRRESGRS
jgi:hypothetical protein